MAWLQQTTLRHVVVLAPLLLIELALALYFFSGDVRGFALPLFLAGAASSAGGYAALLRWWRSNSGWMRFGLCLACAFVAFQISLVAFAIVSGALSDVNPAGFTLIVLLGANIFFFPVWIVLGSLAFVLIRITDPEQRAAQHEAERRLPRR